MNLKPPIEPMEAETCRHLPCGPDWQYEPKWDGFRCLIFRDGDEVFLQSRNLRPLGRYFPEIEDAARSVPAREFILDGELVVPAERRLDFERLQLRLHPAASRVRKLAAETPAMFVGFDLLGDLDGRSLLDHPLRERRQMLEQAMEGPLGESPRLRLSPFTQDPAAAGQWLVQSSYSLDGVVAKHPSAPYRPGERCMVKVKNYRSADCVIGGFRLNEKETAVASLLLGVYDCAGRLNHLGFLSALPDEDRAALTPLLKDLEGPPGFTGRKPGGASRWDPNRSGEYHPLPPKLVVEIEYDHYSGGRFRHGVRFRRWRCDKDPSQCTEKQIHLDADLSFDLLLIRKPTQLAG